MLMGAANAFFTAEAVDEALDLAEEAGGAPVAAVGCGPPRRLGEHTGHLADRRPWHICGLPSVVGE